QLMMAARELFVKKGYRDTTTEEIARRAKVTKGALYYHFKSKEDIMCGLVKHLTDKHFARLEEATKSKQSPAEMLRFLLTDSGLGPERKMRENIDFFVQAMRIPRIKKHLNKEFGRAVDQFVRTMDPKYGPKKQLRQIAVFTYSLYHGLRIRKVLDPGIVDVAAQIRLFDSMLKGECCRKAAKTRKR
ncbi:MAG: TetR/AcrR family transcriptional regulator, partial [Candidatus Zixiibacteriota bacterium]